VRSHSREGKARLLRVTPALLRKWPLPLPAADADKDDRGKLLVVAGSDDVPGAAILAADAALRSGVGKLCIASPQSIVPWVAQAVPEARVVPLGVRRNGHSAKSARPETPSPDDFDAVVIGPGMQSSGWLTRYVAALARTASTLVVDAGAINALAGFKVGGRRDGNGSRETTQCIVTPHAGEMAKLMKLEREYVEANACEVAMTFARTRNAVVALKGARTFIAEPGGRVWLHARGNVGLAVSGSGDCLAGIIGGLAARGASCAQAAVWGVALHGLAGARLTAHYGPLGALAREIPNYIPALMEAMRGAPLRRQSARPGPAH